MENGGNKEQVNSGNANFAWDISWELNTSRLDLATTSNSSANTLFTAASCTAAENSGSTQPEASSTNGLMFPQESNYWLCHYLRNNCKGNHQLRLPLYAGDGSNSHPDPHLMCLKLGKRHYFEDHTNSISPGSHDRHLTAGAFSTIGKRGKPYYYTVGSGGCYEGLSSSSSSSSSVNVPRCQVEGCDVALVNSKDYHKRHKVCEMHSKAPKVIVLGLEQRFCQQCSRFHVVSEFDDAKRSCRRRLAGHNERRRKSSHDSVSRISHQGGRVPDLTPPTGCALSLLSSKAGSCVSPSDLSSRSSAALRELIAEHRAAILARQLIFERHLHHHHSMEDLGESIPNSNFFIPHQHQMSSQTQNWDRFYGPGVHLTLDLMQAPSSAFGFSSTRRKNKEEEEECCELWSTLAGARVV